MPAAEISRMYMSMYTYIYCIRAALAPCAAAGTAGDRFSAATTATGKPQGAWTSYVEATHLHKLGVEGVHMFCAKWNRCAPAFESYPTDFRSALLEGFDGVGLPYLAERR